MIVVCSGPKVILDLPRTREALETMGVTLVGYRTDDMPAFWARHSGLPSTFAPTARRISPPWRGRAPRSASAGGSVCNPVAPDLAIPSTRSRGGSGLPASTTLRPGRPRRPWLLAEIARRSEGRSLAANKRLIVDNAGLAGAVAACL